MRAEMGWGVGELPQSYFLEREALGGVRNGAERGQKLLKTECASLWSNLRLVLQGHKILLPQMCSLSTGFYLLTLKLVFGDSGAKRRCNVCKDCCLGLHKSLSWSEGLGLAFPDRGTFIHEQRSRVRTGRKESPFTLNHGK